MHKTRCPAENPLGQSFICSLTGISIASSLPQALGARTLWSGHTFEVLASVKTEHEGSEVAELFTGNQSRGERVVPIALSCFIFIQSDLEPCFLNYGS